MRVDAGVVVRFALEPVDFRKSIDGLAMAVGTALGRDPMSGELFLFRNRRRTALKGIYWTSNGFVMFYKRLEKGRFAIPEPFGDPCEVALPADMLQALLEGATTSILGAKGRRVGP